MKFIRSIRVVKVSHGREETQGKTWHEEHPAGKSVELIGASKAPEHVVVKIDGNFVRVRESSVE